MKQEMVKVYLKKAYGYVLPYDNLSPVSKGLLDYYEPPKVNSNYHKQWAALLVVQKSAVPSWVKWVHRSEGKTHCEECLKLDGCWFLKEKTPMWPHHPYCHCILEPIDYTVVLMDATTYSDYSKFDPFLFNTQGRHPHGKEKLFHEWGYTVDDARWLQAEMERQAKEKYIAGDYTLGKLNKDGQRVSIQIEITRKDIKGMVSFLSGWMVYPNGALRLTTPYGGK